MRLRNRWHAGCMVTLHPWLHPGRPGWRDLATPEAHTTGAPRQGWRACGCPVHSLGRGAGDDHGTAQHVETVNECRLASLS